MVFLLGTAFDADARGKGRRRRGPPKAHAALYSSVLKLENKAADDLGFTRFVDLAQLQAHIDGRTLWPLPQTDAYGLDPSFAEHDPANAALYAHVRHHVIDFANDVLGAHYATFKERHLIPSLTRTDEYQDRLKRWNRHAARNTTDENRSSHMTGSTIDIATGHLSMPARKWLRDVVAELARKGLVLARQEGQGCLHVMVLPAYAKRAKPVLPQLVVDAVSLDALPTAAASP